MKFVTAKGNIMLSFEEDRLALFFKDLWTKSSVIIEFSRFKWVLRSLS